MKTFHEFLAQYQNAESLDLPKFSNTFPAGVEMADFLVLDGAAVCEVKQIEAVNFPARVQKLIGKQPENFKRDAYNTINNALSKANDQIEETKETLGLANAVGIVVLDHRIPKESSVLSVIDAADRKMRAGLVASGRFSYRFISSLRQRLIPAKSPTASISNSFWLRVTRRRTIGATAVIPRVKMTIPSSW